MVTVIEPEVWLILDNLENCWSYSTNLNRDKANQVLAWCEEQGWVKEGRITDAGIVILLTATVKGSDQIRGVVG